MGLCHTVVEEAGENKALEQMTWLIHLSDMTHKHDSQTILWIVWIVWIVWIIWNLRLFELYEFYEFYEFYELYEFWVTWLTNTRDMKCTYIYVWFERGWGDGRFRICDREREKERDTQR